MDLLKDKLSIKILLSLALLLNLGLWLSVRGVQARWGNVPPVPNVKYADSYGLGDAQLSYRIIGLMLQNLGDTGGRTIALKDYDYDELTKWFFLQDKLDPKSDYTPYLAGFYFSGLQEPQKYVPVLDYLEMVGARPYGQKWHFLVQAIYMARFVIGDMDRALEMAYKLARINNPDMPNWTRQMPAFVMTAQGKKEAAYALMVEILRTSADKLSPNEVNALRAYVCDRILEKNEADINPLCKNIP